MDPVPTAVRFTTGDALRGARLALPIAASAGVYGAVFGVLARGKGLALAEAAGMSAVVFAGAAQFVVLELWAHPLPALSIVLATLLVNARFVLYGAALAPWFGRLSPGQAYGSALVMADESWALAVQDLRTGGGRGALMLGSGLALYAGWVGGTVAGFLAGGLVAEPERWGLDFVFVAVFVALLAGLWRGRADVLPWGVAAVVAVAAERLVPGAWYILLGGVAGSVAGALRRGD
jgi:4-azaleucine resistance transporter AzlC